MDLFDQTVEKYYRRSAPLAGRLRPRTLDAFCGQEHLFQPGSPVHLIRQSHTLQNLILWGPPGTGKTTLAYLLAELCQAHFETLSAVHSGKKDLTRIESEALERLKFHSRPTLLFIDEIHRFNKAQQDGLLGPVERGTYFLIGATTENPSFELNAALLSRMQVLTLKQLPREALEKVLERALADSEKGLGKAGLRLSPRARSSLLDMAAGDARRILNILELAALAAVTDKQRKEPVISTEDLSQGLSRRMLLYDKTGEEHYNAISAFIKSVRGSDPDAAIYYLARMLEGGEDPVFIARRLVILASEDIGNADIQAAMLAAGILTTVKAVGMPEARIPLAQLTTYLSLAPKSNASYLAIDKALGEVKKSGPLPIPLKILNAPTALMKESGYGENYHYAHDYAQGFYPESYLPETLTGTEFYQPGQLGMESQMAEKLAALREQIKKQNAGKRDKPHPEPRQNQ